MQWQWGQWRSLELWYYGMAQNSKGKYLCVSFFSLVEDSNSALCLWFSFQCDLWYVKVVWILFILKAGHTGDLKQVSWNFSTSHLKITGAGGCPEDKPLHLLPFYLEFSPSREVWEWYGSFLLSPQEIVCVCGVPSDVLKRDFTLCFVVSWAYKRSP